MFSNLLGGRLETKVSPVFMSFAGTNIKYLKFYSVITLTVPGKSKIEMVKFTKAINVGIIIKLL